MSKQRFSVKAIWDEEANVFYSVSDIAGLHIEAQTIEEFEAETDAHAVDLILANHIKPSESCQRLSS